MSKLNGRLKLIWAALLVIAICIGIALYLIRQPHKTASRSTNSVASESQPKIIDGNAPQPCTGNSQDECKIAPSIDFYPGGSEGANNPEYQGSQGQMKEITGRITELKDHSIVLKTSSGRLFTVDFPLDAVAEFNTVRSSNYQNIKVEIGDALYVGYTEASDQHDTHITATRLMRSSLLLKDNNPKLSNTLEKY